MRIAVQGAALVVVIVVAALIAWKVWGSEGPCEQAAMEEGVVCLTTVAGEEGLLWVDARSRAEWNRDGVPGSVLLTESDEESFDDLLAQSFQRVAAAQRVVVYDGEGAGGSAQAIAEKLRGTGLAREVVVVFGGWKVLEAGGLTK